MSILERKRRLTQWDIKPPGYENVTAEQAKLSGMFPLPGAPRQQPMDPSRLQAFMNQPAGSADSSVLKPSNARQAKRLFVYNLPASATDDSVTEFFNLQLNGLNVIHGVDPCLSAQIAKDRSFALLDFKTPEDATVALALDGITMEDNDDMETTNGTANGDRPGLSIRRPKDYIAPPVTEDADYQEGVLSNVVKDSANKISIVHIPTYLTDDQVVELLASFGELKAFILVKDTGTEQSRVSHNPPAFHSHISPFTISNVSFLLPSRASPSASTLTQPPPTSRCRASTAWSWATTTWWCSGPASARSRRPAWRWGSTRCRCSRGRCRRISSRGGCCSC